MQRQPRPYDTTTLNYNWQIWETDAFSLYSGTTDHIDEESAEQMVRCVVNFMIQEGFVAAAKEIRGYCSQVIADTDLVPVRPYTAGLFQSGIRAGQRILKGQPLAFVTGGLLMTAAQKKNCFHRLQVQSFLCITTQ